MAKTTRRKKSVKSVSGVSVDEILKLIQSIASILAGRMTPAEARIERLEHRVSKLERSSGQQTEHAGAVKALMEGPPNLTGG